LFLNNIVKGLQNNKKIELRGFGTFSKKINKEKFVRNPKTNEKIYKKGTYKIHFKIGKILHKRINNDHYPNNE
jgi:integration host factor subunit beta